MIDPIAAFMAGILIAWIWLTLLDYFFFNCKGGAFFSSACVGAMVLLIINLVLGLLMLILASLWVRLNRLYPIPIRESKEDNLA